MITMTHKERQKTGRLLAIKLLNKNVPDDSPDWQKVRDLLGAKNESKPGPVGSSKAKGTRKKQHEAMARRKREYPKLIEEGYNNSQMEKILKISRSVVSHDLMRFGLQAHQRYHWRATNTATGKTGYYTSPAAIRSDTNVTKALWCIDRQAVVGPWLIERGCWYQDSKGVWREAES
jgi:hypothetical protein